MCLIKHIFYLIYMLWLVCFVHITYALWFYTDRNRGLYIIYKTTKLCIHKHTCSWKLLLTLHYYKVHFDYTIIRIWSDTSNHIHMTNGLNFPELTVRYNFILTSRFPERVKTSLKISLCVTLCMSCYLNELVRLRVYIIYLILSYTWNQTKI